MVVGAVVAAALSVAGAAITLGQPPLPGRGETDAFTVILSALLYVASFGAGTATVAAALRAAWLTPARAADRTAAWSRLTRPAVAWTVLSLLTAVVNAAAAQGFPISYVLADPFTFLSSVQTAQAWLVTAVGAFVIAVLARRPRRWATMVLVTVLGVALSLPAVVTGTVSVGADHDLATDLSVLLTPAWTLAAAASWAALSVTGDESSAAAARLRSRRIMVVTVTIALVLRIGVAWYELAGTAPWQTPYGMTLLALGLVWIVLVLLALRSSGTAAAAAAVATWVALGIQAALVNLVPPRFLLPQSSAVNYLGYELPGPPDVLTPFLVGRPNLLLATTAIVMIAVYLVGVVRLRRRGDRWSIARTGPWVAGWLLVLWTAISQAWVYSSITFSWHMGIHMALGMVAPPLLVLGGPATLALRALPAVRAASLPVLRQAVAAVIGSRFLAVVMNPVLVWVVFVAGFYVLYFTPLFGGAMRYHWAHQLMTYHFLVIGYLFYSTGIGVDRPPRDVPPVARLGLIFAAMPFHSFFSIAVLSGAGIGEQFFATLDVPWIADLAQDQQLGGQIGWAMGEIPMLVVVVALLAQWFRQDTVTANRADRAAARDGDAELEAYNELLAELARRDQGGPR